MNFVSYLQVPFKVVIFLADSLWFYTCGAYLIIMLCTHIQLQFGLSCGTYGPKQWVSTIVSSTVGAS
jgi:hypothetical protein